MLTRCVFFHSEDVDGWTAPPSRPLHPVLVEAFRQLEGLSVERDGCRYELRIALNSGKAPEYLAEQAARFGGRCVIACNGAAWRGPDGETRLVAPPNEDFAILRRLLGLAPDAVNVSELRMGGRQVAAAIEPGKQVLGRDIVLTLFPEPRHVAHRWRFSQSTDRYALHDYLWMLIREHGLQLFVLELHGDGGLDVVAVVDGMPVQKWTLARIALQMFPGAQMRVTHGGDGSNDLPAMELPEVRALTSSSCEIRERVDAGGGLIVPRPPVEGLAVLECYEQLAAEGFYGPLSDTVRDVLRHWL